MKILVHILKRIIEVFFVVTLFILTLPIIIYSIYRIKKESIGPIFFRRECNTGNETFIHLQFRSMHVDSHFDPYSEEVDERVFPYGRFMKKTKIDLLPQMWNVLMGDINIKNIFTKIKLKCFFTYDLCKT